MAKGICPRCETLQDIVPGEVIPSVGAVPTSARWWIVVRHEVVAGWIGEESRRPKGVIVVVEVCKGSGEKI